MKQSHAFASAAALILLIVFALAAHLHSLQPPEPTPFQEEESWTPVASFVDTPGYAKQVLAADLLARKPTLNSTTIPKLLHQSWKSLSLPPKFVKWSNTCRKQHADWEWVLWTDADNLALVQKHFPWLESSYRSLPSEIYRADLARVYADLDTDCLRPTESLQDSYEGLFVESSVKPARASAMFGRMGTVPDFAHSIPNAWMASSPGHPFFVHFAKTIMEHFREHQSKWWAKMEGAEHITGPEGLRDAILQYEDKKIRFGFGLGEDVSRLVQQGPFPFLEDDERQHELILLPSRFIYPYSWNDDGASVRDVCSVLSDTFDADRCKAALEVDRLKSVSITYWSHTHTPSGHDNANMKHLESNS